jgi:hypothetical protein
MQPWKNVDQFNLLCVLRDFKMEEKTQQLIQIKKVIKVARNDQVTVREETEKFN